jgi:hypothetical protein
LPPVSAAAKPHCILCSSFRASDELHDLRDTAASLAVAAGANVKAVQRMLGHASSAMTLDIYAGLFDGDLDAVADRLDEVVTGVVRTQGGPSGLDLGGAAPAQGL